MEVDAEGVVRAVFKLLRSRIADGEVEQIASMMPRELRELWWDAVAAMT